MPSRVSEPIGCVPTSFPSFRIGHSVGDFKDLIESMRDVDNSDPAAAHLAHVVEEQVDLSARDDGCRLVEDEKPGLAHQRLGDLDHLLIGEREIPDTR